MKKIAFSWDTNKAKSNLLKHKVSFEEAKSVFEDEYARLLIDYEHSDSEERFILLGISSASRILTVVHCFRDIENTIRIISARKATTNEQKQYKEFLL